MLPTEFYLQNATTLLLWIFQFCSHDVLLFLILLGVLVVVCSISILGLNVTRIGYSLVIDIVNIFLRKLLNNYFQPSEHIFAPNAVSALSNSIFRRIVSDSTTDSSTIDTNNNNQTPRLPQYLALQPAQWAAIEAAINNTCIETENPVFNSLLDTTGQFSSAPRNAPMPSPPLRRSNRLRRPRNLYSS